jgi:hypothetical protein
MMQARWVRQIAAVGGLTLAGLATGTPAIGQAQQDDAVESNSIWNLERRVWGSVVRGLGLRDPNAPAIDYRERSPLVVPPSRELPPPQARATPRDPAWPTDPDAARARKQADSKRKLGAGNVDGSRSIDQQSQPLTPDQLNRPGAAVPSSANRSNAPVPGSDSEGRPVAPSELGYFGGLFSGRAWGFGAYQNEVGTFTNEPPRTQLTEPPPGYQTPSPAQPYGNTRRVERARVEKHDPAR